MLDTPLMLWELSVTEQRYRAVLEVMAGIPVTEVAGRYGVSRQSVHAWLGRYRDEGPPGLADRSHKVDAHPWHCVIARAVRRATARPVCRAFIEAMTVYGVPEEVLTDNGTVFTGRFIKPRPAEVLSGSDLPGERHHRTADQAPVTDHHGQDRAAAPVP